MLLTYEQRVAGMLAVYWSQLPGYDEEHVAEFERISGPVWSAAKVGAVAASAGFFAIALGVRPVAVSPLRVLTVPDIRAPFTAVWHAYTMGRPYEEAVQAGLSATAGEANSFIQSTARLTGDVVAEKSNVRTRWARVPSATACQFCRDAAGSHYLSAESADFGHDNDHCAVVPA